MLRRALSAILASALCLASLPAGAQDFAPNTLWGEAPSDVVANAANAVLQDSSGRPVLTVPVVEGRFAFRDVPPGDYVVLLQDGAGKTLARSQTASLTSGAVTKALFASTRPAVAVVGGEKGLGATGWVILGAAAVGITTAVVVASRGDQGTASPSR